MIQIFLLTLILASRDVTVTGKGPNNLVVITEVNTGNPHKVYLAHKKGRYLKRLVELSDWRGDWQGSDVITVCGNQIVIHLRDFVEVGTVHFVRNVAGEYKILEPVESGGFGGKQVIRFGEYLMGTIFNGDEGPERGTYLWSFSPRALKLARLAYPEGSYELKKQNSNEFQISVKQRGAVSPGANLPSGVLGIQRVEKVQFPPTIKSGYWVR